MKRYRFFAMRTRAGQYLNSPRIEYWAECGVLLARDADTAVNRAAMMVGGGRAVRVETVDEFYRPESLQ